MRMPLPTSKLLNTLLLLQIDFLSLAFAIKVTFEKGHAKHINGQDFRYRLPNSTKVWEFGDQYVKYCDKEDGQFAYPDDCTMFIDCGWLKEKNNYFFYTILSECQKCPPDSNSEEECPTGRFIYDKQIGKCVHPNTVFSDENECGTKAPPVSLCSGPKDTDYVHRLGKTAFYVLQSEKGKNHVNWFDAGPRCEEHGLKLARIDNIQTDVLVARELEKFILPRGWLDNWYWINAKFYPPSRGREYRWEDRSEEYLTYHNFFYRSPRPKGYGDVMDKDGNYLSELDNRIERCIAISMPHPFPRTYLPHKKDLVDFPFQTSWFERKCNSSLKGNVLCMSLDPLCEESRNNSIFTEPSGHVYKDFWVMSNRRFIVQWKAESGWHEAKKRCEDIGMDMYIPDTGDTCLAKNLKNWMSGVTTYSFWTGIKYNVTEGKFLYENATEVPENVHKFSSRLHKRQLWDIPVDRTCVSLTYNFEEFPANPNFCNCTKTSIVLSPENCVDFLGVICKHRSYVPRGKCTTEYYEKASASEQILKLTDPDKKHPKITEFFHFAEDQQWAGGLMRSGFKQPGHTGQCPNGYERVGEDDNYWGTIEDYDDSSYKYDYVSPYWMKMVDGVCKLSVVEKPRDRHKLVRKLTEEDCSKWLGFILCKRSQNAKGRSAKAVRHQALGIGEPLHTSNPV